MRLKSRHSNLEFLNTLRGELSTLDTRISNLTIHSATKTRKIKPESLPPLSVKRPTKLRNRQSRVFKSIDPGCYKEIHFLEKYFNLPSKPRPKKKQVNTLSRPKFPKFQPKILPKATRVDPDSNPVLITEEDMQKGIYSLVNLGIATKDSEIFRTLSKENPPLVHSKALLHNFSIQLEPLKLTKDRNKASKQLNFIFSEPTIPNKESVAQIVCTGEPKGYLLRIESGTIVNDSNFAGFLLTNPPSHALSYLNQLSSASKQFNLPSFTIDTLNLPNSSSSSSNLSLTEAFQFTENPGLVLIIKKQMESEALKVARSKAALKIQSMWRRYKGAARMRRHKLEKSKVHIIEVQYKKYKKKVFTKQFAASLREARSSKFSERQTELKSSWPELKHKHLIEVHIGSCLSSFPVPSNQEIFRFFLLENPQISMAYISLQGLDIDVFAYFELLLKAAGIDVEGRLRVIKPYTLCKNVMSDTSKALYLSLHDLVDLKYVNRGKDLVLVPFATNEYDEYLGDFLKVPIMGPVASVFQRFNRLVRWETLSKAGMNGVQGNGGIWEFQELREELKKMQEGFGEGVGSWDVWVNDQWWKGETWDGLSEVVIKAHCSEPLVLCSLFIDPVGELTQSTSVQILPGSNSFMYPQTVLSPSFISSQISAFTQHLTTLNIFGYVSLEICSKGIMDFELGFNNNLPVNIFFKGLMKGVETEGGYFVAAQTLSEMEQEEYVDENSNFVRFENFEFLELGEEEVEREARVYVWAPFLFHEDLKGQKLTSIFHMCRLESVLFSVSKAEGTIFLPYGNFENGSIGVMGVGIDLERALEFVAQGIFILRQGCSENGKKGNLGDIVEELGLSRKIEEFQKLSEDNQFLLKLL